MNTLRRRPVAVALFCHFVAGMVMRAAGGVIDVTLPFYLLLFLQGGLAALLGHLLGLPQWWIAINLLLPPAAGYALTFGLPAWVYLLAFVALLLVFWNSGKDRVPFYLTNKKTSEEILSLIPIDQAIKFIDLGCGTGGFLLRLAVQRPQSHFVGVESAPLPYLVARIRLAASGRSNVTLRLANLWKQDLSAFDMVYGFLSSDPMAKLFAKARAEMPEGSLFISNTFTPPNFPPDRTIEVADRRQSGLHLWRMPGFGS